MALDLDKRVLCFDGELLSGQDVSLAKDLEEGGLSWFEASAAVQSLPLLLPIC